MSINELKQVIPHPLNPVEASRNWVEVEEKLGLKLPQDYKDFINLDGTGIIGNGILIYNPFSLNQYFNPIFQASRTLSALHNMKDNDPEIYDYPYLPFPE